MTDYYILKGTQLNGLSQANTYGDDCYPATNYPIVRLQNTSTNKVYFARTYNFSTMGVATGASLQSARFNTSNIPYGHYDLCVITNGISSHCISFCHHRPKRPCDCDSRIRHESETCCKSECEDSCCTEDLVPDPEIIELRGEIKRLQNSVRRISLLFKLEEPVREPKFEKDEEEEEEESRKSGDTKKNRKK